MDYIQKIIQDYESGLSMAEVAKTNGRSQSTIQRILKKNGVKIRSFSEAQKLALSTGRATNPTAGVGHREDSKILMSEKTANRWARMTDDERNVLKDKAKERWSKLTDLQKKEMLQLAGVSLRKVATQGSEMEQHVEQALIDAGFVVLKHIKNFMGGEYEIDLFVQDLGVVIELDGPHHFEPIFGEDRLAKTMMYDEAKNGALLSMGVTVLRVKCMFKNVTGKIKRDVSKNIIDTLNKIKSGELTQKLLEI